MRVLRGTDVATSFVTGVCVRPSPHLVSRFSPFLGGRLPFQEELKWPRKHVPGHKQMNHELLVREPTSEMIRLDFVKLYATQSGLVPLLHLLSFNLRCPQRPQPRAGFAGGRALAGFQGASLRTSEVQLGED
jgi:hypothetical protein